MQAGAAALRQLAGPVPPPRHGSCSILTSQTPACRPVAVAGKSSNIYSKHTTLQTGDKASSMCPPCQILSLPPACHRMGLCKACARSISPAGSLLQWRPRARLSALMELWSPWRSKVDAAWPAWMQQSVERLEKKWANSITGHRGREFVNI